MPSDPPICILKSQRAQKLARRSVPLFDSVPTPLSEANRNEAFEIAVTQFNSDADWLVKKIEKRTGHLYAGISAQTERELTVTYDGTSVVARQTLRAKSSLGFEEASCQTRLKQRQTNPSGKKPGLPKKGRNFLVTDCSKT